MKGPNHLKPTQVAITASIAAILSLIFYFTGNVFLTLAALSSLVALNLISFFKIRSFSKTVTEEISKVTDLESEDIHRHVETLLKRESEAIEFINRIRNNEESKPFEHLNTTTGIGANLLALTQKLHEYRIDERKRSWAQGGLAKFSDLQKEGKNVEEFATTIISFLVQHLEVNQGGLFVETQDAMTGERYLELKACYAYDKKKYINKRILEGEGLLGECMLSHTTMFMTDVPSDYVRITSGLGHALPRSIVITPLLYNGVFYGAVEIASFSVLEDYKIKFLEKVCEYAGAEIASRKNARDTEKLLAESQDLANKLQEHEEEMRQNMEELTATQEEMMRKQSQLNSIFSAINNTVASIEFDLDGNVLSGNSIFLGISGYKLETLMRFNYLRLLPFNERGKPQHDMMWKNLRDGQFFSGEFKMLSDSGEEMWMTGTFNPIFDARNVPYKIIMIAHFTTQEKAKQLEMTATITATKNAVAYLEIDTQFQCKTANDRFLKMFGMKRMDLKDRSFCSLLAKSSGNAFKKNLMGVKDQKYFEEVLEFQTNTEILTFVVGFTPIRDHQDRTTRIVVILADKLHSVKVAAVA